MPATIVVVTAAAAAAAAAGAAAAALLSVGVRPLCCWQGARLSVYECVVDGIPYCLVTDSMVAALMASVSYTHLTLPTIYSV